MTLIAYLVLGLYALLASALLLYGLNCLIMVYLFKRRYKTKVLEQRQFESSSIVEHWPVVTTQIPVYNEANVVLRVIRAVAAIEYGGVHQIQVLDDSDDATCALIDREILVLQQQGVEIEVIRRLGREGFKAGALKHAHDFVKGEYVAVFDADFVPAKDFLAKTIPYFLASERLGLIQARWGHLNAHHSILTRVQALGIDGHFMIEQSARCWNNLYMNFNGTAGVWRKQAIESGGGWSDDTLTEDMDLSYRVQIHGWETEYLPDLVVPAEIPEELKALKSQQFRWAKGSTQTALKLLPQLYSKEGLNFRFIQAFLHMTHYVVHPLMIMVALLSYPVINATQHLLPDSAWHGFILTVLFVSLCSSNALYVIAQKTAYRDWRSRLLYMPCLTVVGVGLAVNNTRAVLEALLGHRSDFIRTPKRGDAAQVIYSMKLPWMVAIEISLGLYCSLTVFENMTVEKIIIGPFIGIYAMGFLCVGLVTIVQSLSSRTV